MLAELRGSGYHFEKSAKFQFLCCFANSAHNGQFCTSRPILRKIRCAQNSDITKYLPSPHTQFVFNEPSFLKLLHAGLSAP